jgi:hypothetical protein
MGLRNSKVRPSPLLATYPAVEVSEAILPSRTEFETAVTRLKVHRMRTAAQTLSGTLSAAFRAKLLAEIRETWPAIRTIAPRKTLIF